MKLVIKNNDERRWFIMKIIRIIKYALYIIAFSSILLASGIKDCADWWEIAKPFFAVFTISLTIALTMTYFNKIRRITYPALVCFSAWIYKHKIVMTKFTRNTYRVYKMRNSSFRDLFDYTQDLFDLMYNYGR